MAAPAISETKLFDAERVSCSLSRCSPWKYSSSTSFPWRAINRAWTSGVSTDSIGERGAIDVGVLERLRRPTVIAHRRRTGNLSRRIPAARVEIAFVSIAAEVERAAATGKGE